MKAVCPTAVEPVISQRTIEWKILETSFEINTLQVEALFQSPLIFMGTPIVMPSFSQRRRTEALDKLPVIGERAVKSLRALHFNKQQASHSLVLL